LENLRGETQQTDLIFSRERIIFAFKPLVCAAQIDVVFVIDTFELKIPAKQQGRRQISKKMEQAKTRRTNEALPFS
jgi:hypothetical protein